MAHLFANRLYSDMVVTSVVIILGSYASYKKFMIAHKAKRTPLAWVGAMLFDGLISSYLRFQLPKTNVWWFVPVAFWITSLLATEDIACLLWTISHDKPAQCHDSAQSIANVNPPDFNALVPDFNIEKVTANSDSDWTLKVHHRSRTLLQALRSDVAWEESNCKLDRMALEEAEIKCAKAAKIVEEAESKKNATTGLKYLRRQLEYTESARKEAKKVLEAAEAELAKVIGLADEEEEKQKVARAEAEERKVQAARKYLGL